MPTAIHETELEELISLRSNVADLEAKLRSRDDELKSKDGIIESKDCIIESKERQIASLSRELDWLRKKVFGKMTEKRHLPLDPSVLNEPTLFPDEMSEEEKAALSVEVKKSEETLTRSITVREKPSRKPLDTTKLPVKETHIYPEGTTDEDGNLKAEYVEIGTEETNRIERIPARVFVDRIIRHKVISRAEIGQKYPEERTILTAPLPLFPTGRGMAGASVLTDIILGKFMYHLPFYRIINRYKEYGITISDSTMGGWYEAAVEQLKLLYDLERRRVMESEYIQVDESVIPVIDNEKHKARKGYLWCVRDAIGGALYFYYDLGSRSSRVAKILLDGYEGAVQTDGYEAYDQFEKAKGIRLLGCWAHARRKFVEALEEDRKRATEAIVQIKLLYKVESDADDEGLTAEQRAEKRQKESYPILQTFEKWLRDNYPKVLPQSRTGKAIGYTYSLMDRLARYVTDGRFNIDNNLIENAIRPLAIGRKNYLFCGNDAAAYRAAIVYSLIGCCKAAGADPREWMEDVLRKIPYYRRDGRDLAELLPAAWAAASHE
jgi:transposase